MPSYCSCLLCGSPKLLTAQGRYPFHSFLQVRLEESNHELAVQSKKDCIQEEGSSPTLKHCLLFDVALLYKVAR